MSVSRGMILHSSCAKEEVGPRVDLLVLNAVGAEADGASHQKIGRGVTEHARPQRLPTSRFREEALPSNVKVAWS